MNKKTLKKIVIIVVALLVIGGCTMSMGGDSNKGHSLPPEEVETISYTPIEADVMINDLTENALKAETTYQDTYVAVSGYVSVIDSDGKYISIRGNDEWSFTSVQCYLDGSDEMLNQVINLSIDAPVVIEGKITGIGEVLGYTMDIHSIK